MTNPLPTTSRFRKALAGGLIGLTSLGAVAALPAIADAQAVDGTELTEEERDALRAERHAEREARRAEKLAALSEVLGLSADELQAARESGQSLADIAAAQGVSVDAVIDVLVDSKTEHILDHLAAGDITQEEADERIAALEERMTERVNAEPGERGDGEGRRGGRRGGGPRSSADGGDVEGA